VAHRPLKLLITQAWGERSGGAENFLWTFLRQHNLAEFEPAVVFFQPGGYPRELSALGISTHVIPAGRLRQLNRTVRVIRSLAAVLRREQPDLILNWSAKTQILGSLGAVLAGMSRRVLWWQHEVPTGHWLDRLATLMPAQAIGCSSMAAADAQRRLWPMRPTFVVYPAVDTPTHLEASEGARLRARLGIPQGRIVAGIVGRLQPTKGQDRLLRVVAKLRRRGHDVHALVVGGDPFHLSADYGPYLHRLADELGLSGAVTFTGQVPDASTYMSAMDVLVNASQAEPFGIVLLEAMALGVPVVAFDVAGPAEIVESGHTGLLVPGGNETLLADAVERLIEDAGLRGRLAAAGRQRFASRFTADRMVDDLQVRLAALVGVGATRSALRVR